MRAFKTVGCIALLLVPAMAGRADARLFAYGFGAECCVDQYHYFVCSTSHAIGGGVCDYRGYSMPRYADSGLYGLYGCTWSPRPGVSTGYACCRATDGCRWGLVGPGYSQCGVHDFLFRYPRASPVPGGYVPGGYTGTHASVDCSATSHLYGMLFDMPTQRNCFDRSCGHHRRQAGCRRCDGAACEGMDAPLCDAGPTMQYETPTVPNPAEPTVVAPYEEITPIPATRQ